MKKIFYLLIIIFVIFVGCRPKDFPPDNYYGEWKEIIIDGERPYQRADMSIAFGGNRNLILFGSSNETDIFTNETWEFCFDNNKWTKLNLVVVIL